MTSGRCPCGSGEGYSHCCGRRHRGDAPAPTAAALMQSRFSAFAVGDAAYLLDTWHPATRPSALDLDDGPRWYRLEIIDTADGGPFDTSGTVEFRAHYRTPDGRRALHERSRFTRVAGRWLYVSGEVIPDDGSGVTGRL